MPHVTLKLVAGRTDAQKAAIAEALTAALVASAGCTEDDVSVAIEDVDPKRWVEAVYTPIIMVDADHLYKKPGYDPFGQT